MPPKPASSTGRKGRKSTAATSKPSSKAAPSKPSSRVIHTEVVDSDDENEAPVRRSKREQAESDSDDEEENDELKSAPSDSDEVAEELTQSSKKKASTSKKASKTVAASPKKAPAGRQSLKPASTSQKAIKGGKPSSKTTAASSKKKASKSTSKASSSKRKRTTTSTSDDDGSDDESVPTTRSRSARGYTWEAEVINVDPETIMQRISYHGSIKTDIDADSDHEPGEDKVKFKRDQIIYILPDPATLPGRSEEIGPEELPDDEFWAARILDCCALDQGELSDEPLGILRIAWFYSPDQAQKADFLIPQYKKTLRKHRFHEHEMIASDHIDFVGVDSFCGYPEGRIEYCSMIQGLRVDDAERMKIPAMRTKSTLVKKLIGLSTNKGEPTNADIDGALDRLSKETPEEREKRRSKEKKKALKKKNEAKDAKRRKSGSQRTRDESEDEVTDEE